MATILRNLPTRLTDEDWLDFAPLKVVTIADLRKQRVRGVKAVAGAAAGVAVGYLLYRSAVAAKEEYEALDAIAAGEG